ncbi:snRNP Sm proteins [Malassezia caprae]|uniref:LSM2-LSM8 complex subunit LSM8 n=1 Tax=Malassezia caprae TaxID=1381934 RepID=A0AAF0IVC4_9BASI|nr:snRNP Sm proteins [Malassezia caprae]
MQAFVDQPVLLVCQDGRVITGILCGYDSSGSIVLSSCVERIFSEEAPVEQVPLGVYVLRGDSIAVLGLLDEERDKAVPWSTQTVAPIPMIRHF